MSAISSAIICSRWAALCGLSFLCGFFFFFQLADRELSSSHEARAAQNAQMVLSGSDWALPRLFDGRVELQKPPLYYWLVAMLSSWSGTVSVWAVRLPAALSAAGCVFFVYFLGCRLSRPRAGFLAVLVLATSVHFTWLARVGRIDMPLTLTVTLALGGFALGRQRRLEGAPFWRGWFVLGYLAMAAGVLLKGPIAVLLPALPASIILIVDWQRRRTVPRPELATLLWGLPLLVLVAAPWFVWANYQTGDRLWHVFFWHHNVERGLGSALTAHPWWFYVPRLLLDLLPWSVLIPLAAWLSWRNYPLLARSASEGLYPQERARSASKGLAPARSASEGLESLGLVWFAVMLAFLSLMRFKRADYLLPAYPGFALWMGCTLDRWLQTVNVKSMRWIQAGLTATVTACLIGWGVFLTWIQPRHEEGQTYRRFAEAIRRQTDWPVIFFRAEAHEVAFHVGRPLDTILEWENLAVWARQPEPVYIVMPPACAAAWKQCLPHGELVEVMRTTDLSSAARERPLVLLRSVVAPGSPRKY